jgi:hypothetical protein
MAMQRFGFALVAAGNLHGGNDQRLHNEPGCAASADIEALVRGFAKLRSALVAGGAGAQTLASRLGDHPELGGVCRIALLLGI